MSDRMPFMVRKRAPYTLKKGETFLAEDGKRYTVTYIHEVSFLNMNIIQVIFFGKEVKNDKF
jgi:hypothetical protein